MKSLTRKEEIIMLSILHLKKNAYLVAIVDAESVFDRDQLNPGIRLELLFQFIVTGSKYCRDADTSGYSKKEKMNFLCL